MKQSSLHGGAVFFFMFPRFLPLIIWKKCLLPTLLAYPHISCSDMFKTKFSAIHSYPFMQTKCSFKYTSHLLPHHSNLHRHIHDPQQEHAPDSQDHNLDYSFHSPSSFFASSYSNLVHSSHFRSLCPSLNVYSHKISYFSG